MVAPHASPRPAPPGPPDQVVFYGSLQSGLHLGGEPPFRSLVRLVGPCRLSGRLYEVAGGAYPGLELRPPASGEIVHGELHQILDPAVLDLLDDWEEYDPRRPGSSPYARRVVRLLAPSLDAWVYVGQHHQRGPAVPGGDWRRHRSAAAPSGGAPGTGSSDRLTPAGRPARPRPGRATPRSAP